MVLVETLSRAFYLFGLDGAPSAKDVATDENDELVRAMCSEAAIDR